jgi:hypothetical protein
MVEPPRDLRSHLRFSTHAQPSHPTHPPPHLSRTLGTLALLSLKIYPNPRPLFHTHVHLGLRHTRPHTGDPTRGRQP